MQWEGFWGVKIKPQQECFDSIPVTDQFDETAFLLCEAFQRPPTRHCMKTSFSYSKLIVCMPPPAQQLVGLSQEWICTPRMQSPLANMIYSQVQWLERSFISGCENHEVRESNTSHKPALVSGGRVHTGRYVATTGTELDQLGSQGPLFYLIIICSVYIRGIFTFVRYLFWQRASRWVCLIIEGSL